MADLLSKKPVRGILKKRVKLNDSIDEDGSGIPGTGAGGLRWDEHTIALHDAQRGTRTKIEEPKTPYERGDGGSAHSDEEEDDKDNHGELSHHHAPSHLSTLSSASNGSQGSTLEHVGGSLATKLSAVADQQSRGEKIRPRRAITMFSLDDDHDDIEPVAESSGNDSEEEDEPTPKDPAVAQRKRAFQAKRKMHYDEFSRIKRMRERQARALAGEVLSSSSSSSSDSENEIHSNSESDQ